MSAGGLYKLLRFLRNIIVLAHQRVASANKIYEFLDVKANVKKLKIQARVYTFF